MDFFQQPNQKTTLHKKTTRVSVEKFDENARWEKVEETYQIGDEGPRTDEFKTTYLAGCKHIMHGPAEHGANCSKCKKALCKAKCSNLRCARCLNVICSDCSRLLQSVVFCRKCRIVVALQLSAIASLRGIHNLFRKEIN